MTVHFLCQKNCDTKIHIQQHGVNLIAMMLEPRNHHLLGATFYLVGASVLLFSSCCSALSLPRTSPLSSVFNAGRGRFNDSGSGDGAGGGRAPPPWNHLDFCNGGGDESGDDLYGFTLAHFLMSPFSDDDVVSSTIHEHDQSSTTNDVQPDVLRARGGDAAVKRKASSSNKNIANSVNDILDSLQNMVLRPFQIVGKNLPSLGKKKNNDTSAAKDQEQVLRSTTIQSVTAPTSALLPSDVIKQSATDAKLIGGTLNPESLELTATAINRWYADNGYVLNSVTGATLIPAATDEDDEDDESSNEGRVELKVKEVKISKNSQKGFPVKLRFVERVDDNEIEMNDQSSLITLPVQSTEMSQPKEEQQSFKVTSGVTRPKKIARMTMLEPGSHFRILPSKWSKLVAYPGGVFGAGGGRSAIFSQIHAVRPIPEESSQGDDVSVEIIASENKPHTALEYGLTKSLYNDKWEGEFDLKNTNAFGGGEVATFNVRKGHSNKIIAGRNSKRNSDQKWVRLNGGPLSWRMSIKDSYAGYDLNLFQDNVGGHRGSSIKTQKITAEDESESDVLDRSPMRIGATMRFRLPPSMKRKFKASVVSATFERINEQSIASTSVGVGPVRFNPLHSLQSFFSGSITSGVRSQSDRGANTGVVPYAAGTCTSHQIIPLGSSPANFALRHVASGGTKYLPRHEAISLGLSSKVRGYNYNYQSQTTSESLSTDGEQEQGHWHALKKFLRGGNSAGAIRPSLATSKALSGTVELRVPFMAPSENLRPIVSGTFLFFGDWSLTHAHTSPSSIDKENTPLRCSSAGVGLRKVVQGVPIKVDACITEHGTRGVFFGIGGHEFV